MIVPSTDGVRIAVHELGGTGSALLVSHATGFHGRCYLPLAAELADGIRSIGFDYRGHGDTAPPEGPIVWERYGDDALAMAMWLAERTGEPIDAFGHSMGGACLLMAAHRHPTLFRRIIAFEPIVFPPQGLEEATGDPADNLMVAGALRRRANFPSYEAALANFAAKRPLSAFTPASLEAYVRYGFALDDPTDPDGPVHLKCAPATEAGTFATGHAHGTWDALPEIHTEVLVVAGRIEPMQPSRIAEAVAERLPNGRYLQRDELDHFGPMTHPAEMAAVIREELSRARSGR